MFSVSLEDRSSEIFLGTTRKESKQRATRLRSAGLVAVADLGDAARQQVRSGRDPPAAGDF
jgi:hypothetical protein